MDSDLRAGEPSWSGPPELVPSIFESHAADLAARLAAMQPQRVLDIAAGTGVVTRALAPVRTL